jgi:cytochrome b
MNRETRTIRVWDAFVRVFHWGLVVAFATAWLFIDDDYETIHRVAGYAVAALIAARIAWGIAGTGYARFAQFVRAPSTVFHYLADVARGREVRYLGHNPAGGAMVVALLSIVGAICFTGWLMTTDAFWGSALMEAVHEALTNIALGLIALHVGGVVLASVRHRESLIRAMITGRKRAPEGDDVS